MLSDYYFNNGLMTSFKDIDFIPRFNNPCKMDLTLSFLGFHSAQLSGRILIHVFQTFLSQIASFKLLRIPKRHAQCSSRVKREKRG